MLQEVLLVSRLHLVLEKIDKQLFARLHFFKHSNIQTSDRVFIEAIPSGWLYGAFLMHSKYVQMYVSDKTYLQKHTSEIQKLFFNNSLLMGQNKIGCSKELSSEQITPIHSGLLPTLQGDKWIATGDAAASLIQ